eukprot:TRINITY_DN102591_c0_g1_i1.p1 TRINITY_DN102591_c0_g1~~TRINITY_DN102591_c0_g1_i1.p1  ORF type:complete len:324 (+),score=23.18 TRINITY_DN102591_c0_g1_i1:129-1100(+)
MPADAWKHWGQWLLSVLTMRTQSTGFVYPTYPDDVLPHDDTWPVCNWLVALEYQSFIVIGFLSFLSSRALAVVLALYFSWMFSAWSDLMQAVSCPNLYSDLMHSRLPSAILLFCIERALRETNLSAQDKPPHKGSSCRRSYQLLLPLAAASAFLTFAVCMRSLHHPVWQNFAWGECLHGFPYLIAGIPFQASLLLFTHCRLPVSPAVAGMLSYLSDIGFLLIAADPWTKIFFLKHFPAWRQAWYATDRGTLEKVILGVVSWTALLGVACITDRAVSKPWKAILQWSLRHVRFSRYLAIGHAVLCICVWRHDRAWYFNYRYPRE